MFTGLVEGTGRIATLERRGAEVALRVRARLAAALRRGQSIAVDGVCLTVAARSKHGFEAVVSPQTLSCTTIGLRRAGDRVNLERPLRIGDPLGGHLVQGHVDGVGIVESVRPEGSGTRVRIAFPPALSDCIIPKGSIAVDGVSLTVAERDARAFQVALIPETLRVTGLAAWRAGTPVNLEVDMLGRYVVEMFRSRRAGGGRALTRAFLARQGYGMERKVAR
jgi:riboflavin synthase alpha subunit